jgi:hypothetical protein
LSDATLKKMLGLAAAKKQFVVSVRNIEAGKALVGGQTLAVVSRAAERKPIITAKKRRASR